MRRLFKNGFLNKKMKLKFNPKDWENIHNYLEEWDGWRRKKSVGRPDYTSDSIFLVPLIISLMKSSDNLRWLTLILLVLTLILSIETAFLIFVK